VGLDFMPNEEEALVLDYLPKGRPNSFKPEPIAQVIGKEFFSLLEVVPKAELKAMETVYVGKEERSKIDFIKRRVNYENLTSTAIAELDKAIENIVLEKKQRFLDFFNEAAPITLRRHQLELLPGMGKKHMLDILNERQKKPFESFEDLANRVKLLPDPLKTLVKRIRIELEDDALNHYLFARPPVRERKFTRRY